MPGAYSSKPPAAIVVPEYPDIPLNWNPEWPFPGPNPPGYDPVPSEIVLTSDPTVLATGGSAYASALLKEVIGGAPVGLPGGDNVWAQTWSASIEGASIGLRVQGSGAFVSSFDMDYTDTLGYWGADAILEFDVDSGDVNSVIVLLVESIVGTDEYSDASNITVTGGSYARLYFVGSTGTDSWSSVTCSDGSFLKIESSGLTHVVSSQTGIFDGMVLQLGSPDPTYGVVHTWSLYTQLTPSEWASLDGKTFTIETYFSENFPSGYYNGIHTTYLRIRVYDADNVQLQVAQKDNNLLVGIGVTIGSGAIPAMSISGDVVTVL